MATRPRDASPGWSLPVGDMAWRYDSWESYFYPETINPVSGDGTLRNLYDERDPRVLARFEYIETTGRATELLRGDVAIPRTYDAERACYPPASVPGRLRVGWGVSHGRYEQAVAT